MNPDNLPIFGSRVRDDGVRFTVWSSGETMWLCLFEGEREVARLPMVGQDGIFSLFVPGLSAGARYGFRGDGPYDPEQGLWFDPDKLLLDPYATRLDRAFVPDPLLAARRGEGVDTAALVPKGVVEAPLPIVDVASPRFKPGGLIYELQVRSFTKLHPDVPEEQRGTLLALTNPAVIAHLQRLHVGAVELMPIHAWIDERHLPPLGLTNAWGYNPVSYFALDPRLAPGGVADLRAATEALHDAGIGVILDMVFNHNGESDALGSTLSFRGLDARSYFRHGPDWQLINDTGTGNSIDSNHPVARRLIRDSMRYFVLYAGVDGFRFDLAPALGRGPGGFTPDAPLLGEIAEDPVLADRVMIAEPWDIGPGGYQLGRFGNGWLEWNDRYRDDVRRFWRGDPGMVGALATRVSGSSDVFGGSHSRSVNFLAAHDGFSLADVTAYAERHNEANGEGNRDGHGENFSWNCGIEGETADPAIREKRREDVKAMLSTLFISRGTIMLTAGDEFGRTQRGNNNAYAQDNPVTWIDWEGRDRDIEQHAIVLSALRAASICLSDTSLLSDEQVSWFGPAGQAMTVEEWESPTSDALALQLLPDGPLICINRSHAAVDFHLPGGRVAVNARSVEIIA